jgi:hypothetical protein
MRVSKRFRQFKHNQLGGLAVIGASLLFICNGFLQLWIVGSVALLLFVIGAFIILLSCPWFGKDFWNRFVFGVPVLLFVPTSLLLITYFSGVSFSWVLSCVVMVFCVLGLLLLPQDKFVKPRFVCKGDFSCLWLLLSIFGSLLLMGLFFAARTGDAIISPWNYFSGEPFVLLLISVFLFLVGAWKCKSDIWVFAAIPLVFSFLSVSLLMYKVGFGFDPFLHRAAEEALLFEGVVFPKQFLYSGQYLFVAFLSSLTSIEVKWIDIWLVPVFASAWLPIATFVGLLKGWGVERQKASALWLIAFLIPYQLLTFTVPFTITFLLFVGTVFLFPLAIKERRVAIMLIFFFLVSCFFHPLLAAPLLAVLVAIFFSHQFKSLIPEWIALVLGGVMTALSVPTLLILYFYQTGQSIQFSSLFTNSTYFTSLWQSPYWDPFPNIPWALDFIYDLRYALPFVFAVLALVLIIKKSSEKNVQWFLVFWVGLLLAIYGTSTLFHFKDIISHEQQEFALRLAHAWFVASLPLVGVVLSRFMDRRIAAWGLMGALSFLLLLAWYFSYPQYNMKFLFYSPGVSEEDVQTVQLIDHDAEGSSYLVLSNQMVSAAAIQEFGFAQYYPLSGKEVLWYAIPTGGPLYENYVVLLDGGFSENRRDDLYRETGVEWIYVVVPAYYHYTIPSVMNAIEELSEWKIQQKNMIIYKLTHSL